MIGGVSFQPGGEQQQQQQNGNGRTSGGGGVQEAIKILSLRLPKVLGAQAAVPMPLLTSQGSGGTRVDAIVNQIMSRIGRPQGPPSMDAPPTAPMPAQPMPSGPHHPFGELGTLGGQEPRRTQGPFPAQQAPAPPMPPSRPPVPMFNIDQPSAPSPVPNFEPGPRRQNGIDFGAPLF